jgi:hypothetical protein
MEEGRRASEIMVPGMGCPSPHILTQRKEEEGESNQAIIPIPTPRLAEIGKT